jgi:hypothetical protein
MPPYDSDIAVLKAQWARIVADIESEKATRARVNHELLQRIDESDDRTAERFDEVRREQRKSDRVLYMILGGLVLIQFILPLLRK